MVDFVEMEVKMWLEWAWLGVLWWNASCGVSWEEVGGKGVEWRWMEWAVGGWKNEGD